MFWRASADAHRATSSPVICVGAAGCLQGVLGAEQGNYCFRKSVGPGLTTFICALLWLS